MLAWVKKVLVTGVSSTSSVFDIENMFVCFFIEILADFSEMGFENILHPEYVIEGSQ
jgi:hypothetical protein